MQQLIDQSARDSKPNPQFHPEVGELAYAFSAGKDTVLP